MKRKNGTREKKPLIKVYPKFYGRSSGNKNVNNNNKKPHSMAFREFQTKFPSKFNQSKSNKTQRSHMIG